MQESEIRGTPIYLTNEGEQITLVPEIRLARRRLRKGSMNQVLTSLDPSALYLIDHRGVKRLAIGSQVKRQLQVIAVSLLLGPLLNLLARRRKLNG
jgi:phage/plasmid primase-like uncharacterized protein